MVIYKITNPNNRVYIGQSIDIKRRFRYYRNLQCKGQPRLYNSLKKYGWETHIFEIIEKCKFEDLNIRERYWQEYYDVLDNDKGMNCTYVKTDVLPKRLSKNTKLKMSKNNSGHMKGKKLSQETKDKIRKNSARAKKVINKDTGQIFNSAKDCYNSLNLKIKYRSFICYLSGSLNNKTNCEWMV